MIVTRVVIDSLDSLTWWVVGGTFVCVALLIMYGVCLIVSQLLDMWEGGK